MNVLLISLGCDKNFVDSEHIIGFLKESGFQITNEEKEADIIIINTCCFIHDAKEESIHTILEMAEYKKSGRLRCLIVTGCLAQRYQDEIIKEINEVDALIGITSYDKIAFVIKSVLSGNKMNVFNDMNLLVNTENKRVNTSNSHYSYLKIAEGCNKHCTYCIIPSIRGEYRSIPMDKLLKEAEYLSENGVRELIIVAQETTLYGIDIYGRKMLPELLRKLCDISLIKWIRVLYCYPEEITDELIQVIKEEPKICKYIDMPIQHISDSILKRMGRKTSSENIYKIIQKIRQEIPDITLRTSLITGFPGETATDHEKLLEFVREIGFERLGVFTYSKEEGTPAAKYKGQIPKKVKTKQYDELMIIQQNNAFTKAEQYIGKIIPVIIDGELPDERIYVGRGSMDSPNIDGMVFVYSQEALISGDIVNVKITDAKGYDIIGTAVMPLEQEVL